MDLSRESSNYTIFSALVAEAERHLQASHFTAAAVYAQIASAFAMLNHADIFVSPRLERIARHIGCALLGADSETPPDRPRRGARPIIHVATQVFGIGGHTRMIWRWLEQDRAHTHIVALTRQGPEPLPRRLRAAAEASGGSLVRLDARPGSLIARARALRRLARTGEIVVLHINPYDIVPLIAFADRRNLPPIALLNHTDHLFGLGVSTADLYVNQRESGAQLALTRRGVADERLALLPIVVPQPSRSMQRSEAKRRLGLPPDSLLLLSIARAEKYVPLSGSRAYLNDLVLPHAALPVLHRFPQAHLFVVGPPHTGAWEAAAEATGGRVRAFGSRPDTALFYQAADVYLDSFPFTSITSLLEAGSYGTPLVGCFPYGAGARVLCADTPALRRTMIGATTSAEYHAAIERLLADAAYRAEMGALAAQGIARDHSGAGWQRWLSMTYSRALEIPAHDGSPPCDEYRQPSELDALLHDLYSGDGALDGLTAANVQLLPPGLRLRLWLELAQQTHRLRLRLLFPEWLASQILRLVARPA